MSSDIADSTQPPVHRVRASKPKRSALNILREVWGARELVAQFVRRDITVRYAQAFMGFAWALLMPMLIVGAGLVFRMALSTLSGGTVQGASVASLALKALPWAFFSAAISLSTQSIVASADLIGKVYFPRETLPLSSVLGQCVDLFVGLTAVGLVLPFLGTHFSVNMLWVPVLLALLIVFTSGCALILSCANLFYRDVKYIVQVVLNFGIFATPVFFEPQMLGPTFGPIMMRLPLSPFIQGLDVAVVRGHSLLETLQLPSKGEMVTVWSPWMLLYAIVLSVTVFALGLRIFRRASSRFAEMA